MIVGMAACGGAGDVETHRAAALAENLKDPRGIAANHHKKCGWVSRVRPKVFWAVSRDVEAFFDVGGENDARFHAGTGACRSPPVRAGWGRPRDRRRLNDQEVAPRCRSSARPIHLE
jgi:hypothetical protein